MSVRWGKQGALQGLRVQVDLCCQCPSPVSLVLIQVVLCHFLFVRAFQSPAYSILSDNPLLPGFLLTFVFSQLLFYSPLLVCLIPTGKTFPKLELPTGAIRDKLIFYACD